MRRLLFVQGVVVDRVSQYAQIRPQDRFAGMALTVFTLLPAMPMNAAQTQTVASVRAVMDLIRSFIIVLRQNQHSIAETLEGLNPSQRLCLVPAANEDRRPRPLRLRRTRRSRSGYSEPAPRNAH